MKTNLEPWKTIKPTYISIFLLSKNVTNTGSQLTFKMFRSLFTGNSWQCNIFQKFEKHFCKILCRALVIFLSQYSISTQNSTCKMNLSSITIIWIGPRKSSLFVCEISRGTKTYVTKSRLMFFAVVYSLQLNNFGANFPGLSRNKGAGKVYLPSQ